MEENMYENKILDAIQMLVDNAIDKATFDKTIRGVISKCVDEKNGKYIVIYQDSSFYAYSTDTNQTYSAGTPVYVLVPRNDMTQTKTIIGSVNKLGSDYISTIENNNRYEAIGNSVATLNSEQGVCSYKNDGDILVLYDKDAASSIVDIDTVAATTYIKQAKYLTLGGEFRTALAKEQRYKGNYGLGFDINFTDNMTNETVKRTYLVDVNNMLGNPYEYTKASNQKIVFDIDSANFVDIDKIYLFCYDFPVTSEESKPNDIFIANITLEAAAALTDDELAGNKLTLITPQGIYFSNNDSITSSRKIDTEIKIDNKVVNKDSSLLKYFWFKENYNINTSSLLYNRYGGNGWECLNEYNVVETDGNNNPTIIDWITNQSSYIIKKNNTIARETDYKCVVSYNNEIVLTKKFTIYNYSSNYIVTIDSDSGTYFSYDNGHPTLTCAVNQVGTYEYVWGMMNGNGAFTPIQETTTTNAAYHTAADRYIELETGLRNGTIVLTAAIQQEFANLKYTLEQYNNDIMRVEDNVIYNLKLNMITNFATFVCSVYNNGAYIGKGSIKIENDLNTSDNSYTLIINNGDQVFKYNGDGISPTSRSLDKPQELYPLSFTLYDEKGNEINNDVISADKVFWTVPTTNTMIKVSAVHGNPSEIDEYAETATYTGYKSFNFEIPVLYTANKTKNTIQLKVKYKNKIIVANTELMFLKEGESGSNGTDFICRIVPNTIDGAIPPLYPIVTWNNNAEVGATNPTINFTPRTSGVWFKAQLYHNGSEIFDSPISGLTIENKNVTLKWEIMKNKYDTTHSDVSNFNVNSSTGVFSYNNLDNITNETLKSNPANIVKCTLTYDGIDYVATMPIILVKVNNSGSAQYKVELIENTGFRYAMYTTDGRTPIYDNSNPFALKVIQTVENIDQDISINTLTDYAIDYNWNVKGLIYANDWQTQSNLILDTLRNRNLQRNEKYYKPIDNFNGLCLSNALFCNIQRNNQTLATIHLPVHMYLNRYGNAAMNGWDGNHIAIDEDGGFILAPQVGAGKKEQDNSFTGVFMGSVKEAGSNEEEVGLFGYNSGTRTLELNSKDGSAKFGKSGSGQIIIEPGEDKAVIKSGDYEMILTQALGKYIAGNVYFRLTNGVYTELKEGTDYHNGDSITGGNVYVWSDGSGMEIDLNDPHIRFGSGNFRIDPDGNVYAKGYATIAELESGDIDIPGVENWKVEYVTDRVQFETDSTLVPTSADLTKTITGKCLYKDNYVSGYTVQLVDASGTVITHDQSTDGIGIVTSVTGQDFTISFNAQSQYQWTNAVNNYYFKFSYSPIGSTSQTAIKQFSVNAVMIGADGRSITSVEVKYQGGTSGTVPPSDEFGWVINPPSVAQGNYLWTRTKINYSTGNPDISYSVAYMGINGTNGQDGQPGQDGAPGVSSYTHIKYSVNSDGNPMVDNPANTKYIGICIDSNIAAPTTPSSYNWSKYVGEDGTSVTVKGSYNTLSELIAAHPSGNTLGDGYVVGLNLYVYTNAAGGGGSLTWDWNDVGQFKGQDGTNGTNGTGVWTTTVAPTTPNYTFTISNLTGMNRTPLVGDIIVYSYYRYTISSVSTTTVLAGTRTSIRGATGAAAYSAYLTNESQTLVYGTTQTITTQLYGFGGTTSKTVQIKTVNGVTAATTDTDTGITGIKFKVSSTSAATGPTITFTTTTALPQSVSGSIPIVFKVTDDSADRTLNFTYSTTTKGADGAAAVVYEVEPSVYSVVKKVDNAFAPITVTFYGYSKTGSNTRAAYSGRWLIQTSENGSSWTTVYTGTSNASSYTYTVSGDIKLIKAYLGPAGTTPTTSNALDSQSVSILNDSTDIEIGGRNLILGTSKDEWSFTANMSDYYKFSDYAKEYIKSTDTLTLTLEAKGSVAMWFDMYYRSSSTSYTSGFYPAFQVTTDYQKFIYTHLSTQDLADMTSLRIRQNASSHGSSSQQGTLYIKNLKLEKGNINTDWTAAPEDLKNNQLLQYTTTENAAAPASGALWAPSVPISTEFYIWQRMQTTYDNGTIEYSTPVCIYTPPIQISSIEEQYFIHTSDTVVPPENSSDWLNKKPEWKDEYYQPATRRYLWIRTKYTYSGNISKVEYSTPYYDPTWETISALNKSITDNAQAVNDAINNGYVTIKDGYIEIKDTSDPNKGILLSKEGISFKVNGNTYTSVWALDGTFNAQSILVKNLNASNILSGTLTLQEDKDHEENNGVFVLLNDSGTEVAKVDVNGLKITAVDGSYIYLRTGEDDNTKKGVYLVDATGNIFVSSNTTNGIFTVTKEVITDYQEFSGNIRIIQLGNRGIGFIGI